MTKFSVAFAHCTLSVDLPVTFPINTVEPVIVLIVQCLTVIQMGNGLIVFLSLFVSHDAGEWIDMSLGVALGISTMAAAGLGNLVSDVAGVASAGYVESISSKIGVKTPDLTKEQAHQWQTKWATALGRTWGISIGCLLGMFPLLFFPSKEEKEQRKEEEKEERRKAEENAKNSSSQAHHHVHQSDEDNASSPSPTSSTSSLSPVSVTQSSSSQGSPVRTQGISSTNKES